MTITCVVYITCVVCTYEHVCCCILVTEKSDSGHTCSEGGGGVKSTGELAVVSSKYVCVCTF